jgi:hypothetical protein
MPTAREDERRHEAMLVRNERRTERDILAFFLLLLGSMEFQLSEIGLDGVRAAIENAQPELQQLLKDSYMRSGPDGIRLTSEMLPDDEFSEEAALLGLLVWAESEAAATSRQITKTTIKVFNEVLADQMAINQEVGASLDTKKVLREVHKRNKSRAGTIGTTEAGKGIGKGQSEAAEEMQRAQILQIRKTWRSKRDLKVRDTHARADSRYSREPIGVNENFQVGASFGLHPLASTLSAAETIHCRCFARYIKVKI